MILLLWNGADENLTNDEGRKAEGMVPFSDPNGQRIHDLLASAPADRAWRRRRWLVLARSRPRKMQLLGGSSGSSKAAKATCGGGELAAVEFLSVARSVVGVQDDNVFRLVVSFL